MSAIKFEVCYKANPDTEGWTNFCETGYQWIAKDVMETKASLYPEYEWRVRIDRFFGKYIVEGK
jgi:hypothetical protein